jgi:hypothetical protein
MQLEEMQQKSQALATMRENFGLARTKALQQEKIILSADSTPREPQSWRTWTGQTLTCREFVRVFCLCKNLLITGQLTKANLNHRLTMHITENNYTDTMASILYHRNVGRRTTKQKEATQEYLQECKKIRRQYRKHTGRLTKAIGKVNYIAYRETAQPYTNHNHRLASIRTYFLHKPERQLLHAIQEQGGKEFGQYNHSLPQRTITTTPETYAYASQHTNNIHM